MACGFGTVYEGIEKVGVSGDDAVLVTGLGPVGLATAMLARAMGAGQVIGIDAIPERLELARTLGLCDAVLAAGPDNVAEVRRLTGGAGVERAFDCSAHAEARLTAIQATRKWGRICFLGEGGERRVPAVARRDPRPEDDLRLLGDEHLAHGGAGRAPRALAAPSRSG